MNERGLSSVTGMGALRQVFHGSAGEMLGRALGYVALSALPMLIFQIFLHSSRRLYGPAWARDQS